MYIVTKGADCHVMTIIIVKFVHNKHFMVHFSPSSIY